MGEIQQHPPQPLHTRTLQHFKMIEDLTTTLHEDIQRQYQYHKVMYGDLEHEYLFQAMLACDQEMDNLVIEYQRKVPHHTCGERAIRLWAGTGERIKQAALWKEFEKTECQLRSPRAQYKRVTTQFQEEIVRWEECSTEVLTPSVVRFSLMPSPRSLAEELDATDLDERDRELAEIWRGGMGIAGEDEAEVDCTAASEVNTCGSGIGTTESDDGSSSSLELVRQRDDGKDEESTVLLPNDPSADTLFIGATRECMTGDGGYSGVVFD